MTISVSDTLKDFIDAQVQNCGYNTASDYLRELVREDQAKQDHQRLSALILEGLESGPAIEVDHHYWQTKREGHQ
jgi:antitoxin ParD1/3/4